MSKETTETYVQAPDVEGVSPYAYAVSPGWGNRGSGGVCLQ